MVLDGRVRADGWVNAVPEDVRSAGNDECMKAWLKLEGGKVRKRLRGKYWSEWDGEIPAGDSAAPWRFGSVCSFVKIYLKT